MAFPTLTWTNTTDRTIACAGTNPTLPELLVGIKAAIDNDSLKWMTSDYSLGNGTLEIKRKGSPTGEQASVRILFFGGQTPNAAALSVPSPTANTTSLYCGLSVDAATTGPAASYASAAPYSTKYVKANLVMLNTGLSLANNPKVMLIECDDALVVVLHDSANCATAICGYLLEDVANNVLHWLVQTSVGHYTNALTDTTYNASGVSWVVPTASLAASFHGQYWNSVSGTLRSTERINGTWVGLSTATNPILGASASAAAMLPVAMTDHANASVSTTAFFGFLRQIRLGPAGANGNTLRNNSGTVQAILGGVPAGLTGNGVWFDQVA